MDGATKSSYTLHKVRQMVKNLIVCSDLIIISAGFSSEGMRDTLTSFLRMASLEK